MAEISKCQTVCYYITNLKSVEFKMNSFQSPSRHGCHPGAQDTVQREGDWICYHCNNLNFSFRKRCNRCKNQTREQNQQIASYYQLMDSSPQSSPLQDRTNFPSFAPFPSQSNPEPEPSCPYSGSENTFLQSASSKLQRKPSLGFEGCQPSPLPSKDMDWSLFLSQEEEWDSSFSESSGSGENQKEEGNLDWEIEQMVTKIII